eukprot:Gb_36479 [translate_table: standard]
MGGDNTVHSMEDQEGQTTKDDDAFIDDTGMDPNDQYLVMMNHVLLAILLRNAQSEAVYKDEQTKDSMKVVKRQRKGKNIEEKSKPIGEVQSTRAAIEGIFLKAVESAVHYIKDDKQIHRRKS